MHPADSEEDYGWTKLRGQCLFISWQADEVRSATDRDPLLTRVLASCGVPHPSIAYVGAASGDSQPFFSMISGHLRRCGAGRVTLASLASGRGKLEKTRAILESDDMVFISGGDVEAGMEVLEERQILPFLRELFERGKPFFGSSAGSIMLGRQWVRWEDPDDDATASLFPCMGFAPIVCDTHGEAEEWEELRGLLRLTPEGTLGYGIPTGAGLCVSPGRGIGGTRRSRTLLCPPRRCDRADR